MNSAQLVKGTPNGVVRVVDGVHVVGVCGATLIQIWRGTPTKALTMEANRIAEALIASSFL